MFFGREKQVDAFVNRLRVQPLLVVVGRSGAGKSSFVQAGVIPALDGWQSVTLRPGPSPLAALTGSLQAAGVEFRAVGNGRPGDHDRDHRLGRRAGSRRVGRGLRQPDLGHQQGADAEHR